MCTRRISMVPSLAAAVPAVGLDAADHHLDGEHHPYLLRLASARTWASLVGSWLDYAAGIWIGGSGRCNYRVSPVQTTRGKPILHRLRALANAVCKVV